ncbi:hypothetical protein L3X38_002435 [Prunus dulcis]|uniref:Topoisomerase 6 subunit A/Spo11 TOPRIM domain-containing protein n=1 Tax=Prunus dulcis TaxID=3755 RepID=A0AAD4WY12_PRUDU|nr:hypothetical protein L3X38_002435 [Prunus dulcis]
MSKRDKDVPANKKLCLSLHSIVQDYLQGDVSTQPELQPNIDLEFIEKNIKDNESDFAPLSKSYTVFKHRLGRRLLPKHNTKRSSSGTNSELCMYILFVLLTIYKQCFIGKSQYIKKREIYYTDTNQFKSEYDAYGVIDYVLCVLIRIRLSLRVISDSIGKVIGQFTFVCDDTPHDCSSSAEEIASCHRIVCTSFNSCDASFILLVEKNTVFHGLAQVKFHENAKCIMVSGKGYGDRSTKVFLKKLYYDLRLSVIAIVDCNPYGLQINLHIQ